LTEIRRFLVPVRLQQQQQHFSIIRFFLLFLFLSFTRNAIR
jgi:hypothetical protein